MHCGYLAMVPNPWSPSKVMVLASGTRATGTQAALLALTRDWDAPARQDGEANTESWHSLAGNNRYNPAVPAKGCESLQGHDRDRVRLPDTITRPQNVTIRTNITTPCNKRLRVHGIGEKVAHQAMNPWQTLSSRIVYRNPWLTVREDQVIRPDGEKGIYSVVEMQPSCGVVAINEHDHIALVSQWRYPHDKLSLEIPTGGAVKGEIPLDAAKRELAEETGLVANDWRPLGTIDNGNGATTDVAHIFLAKDLTAGPLVRQGDEHVELEWMQFDEAVQSVLSGDITESVSVASILKAEVLRTLAASRLPL